MVAFAALSPSVSKRCSENTCGVCDGHQWRFYVYSWKKGEGSTGSSSSSAATFGDAQMQLRAQLLRQDRQKHRMHELHEDRPVRPDGPSVKQHDRRVPPLPTAGINSSRSLQKSDSKHDYFHSDMAFALSLPVGAAARSLAS